MGTVISTLEGPSTANFSFVVNNHAVRKGQFVKSDNEDGLLIGFITDLTRANRYFERAESVAEYERGGEPITKNFPTAEWEYIIAEVRALGVYKEGNLIRSTFPAAPGARVFSADDDLLKGFLGFDEHGVNMGKVSGHEVDAKFNLNRLLQKHFAILALSGAGKSYLSSVIVEEILDREKEHGRIAVVIIDVHGEYHGFKESNEYKEKTSIFEGRKVKIALRKSHHRYFLILSQNSAYLREET